MTRFFLIATTAMVMGVSSVALAGPSYDRTPQRRHQLTGGRAAPAFLARHTNAQRPYALTGVSNDEGTSKRLLNHKTWGQRFGRGGQ